MFERQFPAFFFKPAKIGYLGVKAKFNNPLFESQHYLDFEKDHQPKEFYLKSANQLRPKKFPFGIWSSGFGKDLQLKKFYLKSVNQLRLKKFPFGKY